MDHPIHNPYRDVSPGQGEHAGLHLEIVMQNHQVFVLPAQEDIAKFSQGLKPENIIDRPFNTHAELLAYSEAPDVYEGFEDALHGVIIDGPHVTYSISRDGEEAVPQTRSFDSKPEAKAFALGIEDLEGFKAPMLFTADDGADFERLKSYLIADKSEVPTIVIYKSANQITRVIASQGVRVIVLDADGVGLEEDALRTLQIDDQELYVSDLMVTGKVGESAYGEQGIDAEFVRQVVKHVEGLPAGSNASFNKPGQQAEPFPILKSVPVKHWEGYQEKEAPLSHQIDIDDQRLSNGKLYFTVAALEGHLDNLMSVTAEVNTNPQNEAEHLPCLHVHFNEDVLAFTAFKVYDKILLRPENGVVLTKVQGPEGPMYIVE